MTKREEQHGNRRRTTQESHVQMSVTSPCARPADPWRVRPFGTPGCAAPWHSPINGFHIKAKPLLDRVGFPPRARFEGNSFVFSLRRDKIAAKAESNQPSVRPSPAPTALPMNAIKPAGVWQYQSDICIYISDMRYFTLATVWSPKSKTSSLPFRTHTIKLLHEAPGDPCCGRAGSVGPQLLGTASFIFHC